MNRAIGPYANDETHPGERNVFEEYYYDGLGRRVITRTRRTTSCSTTGVEECNSTVQRTVWDGDQILMEVRSNGATDASGTDLENNAPYGTAAKAYPYGRVAYVHAGGIDQPVAVNRIGMANATDVTTIYPHQNWRGQFEFGTLASGTLANNSNIRWPGARTTVDGVVGEDADGFYWYGSVVQGMSDGSGNVYQRNRYYDPSTGRFTQEDPIGLAGGMNLYGFAGGDRVNFSDPMGLCPVCALAYAAFEVGSSLYDAYDLASTAISYSRGRASKLELGATAAGAGIGLVSFGGGLGKGARLALKSGDSWGSATTLARHFRDHGADFGAKSADEYAGMASDFLQDAQKRGLPTKIDSDGVIRVYDPTSNTFGAYNSNGTTRTFFKPTSKGYWDKQPGSSPP